MKTEKREMFISKGHSIPGMCCTESLHQKEAKTAGSSNLDGREGPSRLGDAIVLPSEVPLLESRHSLSALGPGSASSPMTQLPPALADQRNRRNSESVQSPPTTENLRLSSRVH